MSHFRGAAMDQGLKAAIQATGGPVKFAKALGIRRTGIAKWTKCPAHRIIQVEQISGIPREILRPDLYRTHGPDGGKY